MAGAGWVAEGCPSVLWSCVGRGEALRSAVEGSGVVMINGAREPRQFRLHTRSMHERCVRSVYRREETRQEREGGI